MRIFRRRGALAVTLLFTVLVAGCAPEDDPPAPAIPAKVESPAPTTAPTPAAPPRLPALGDLVISPAGIGSLLIGQPVSGTDMIVFDPEFCKSLAPGDPTTYPDGTPIEFGRWVANYPPKEGVGAPFQAHAEAGVITVIEVRNDTLPTAEGLRIGSSLEALTAAYPSLTPGIQGSTSKSLLLATPEGDIVFEVAVASEYGDSPPDTVIYMRIYPPGQHNLNLIAGSDDVVGGCL